MCVRLSSPTPLAFLTLTSPSPSFPFYFTAFYCFPTAFPSPLPDNSLAQFGTDSLATLFTPSLYARSKSCKAGLLLSARGEGRLAVEPGLRRVVVEGIPLPLV